MRGDWRGPSAAGTCAVIGRRSDLPGTRFHPLGRLATGAFLRYRTARCRRAGEAGGPHRDRGARLEPDAGPLCRRCAGGGKRGLRFRGGAEVYPHRPQWVEHGCNGARDTDRPELREIENVSMTPKKLGVLGRFRNGLNYSKANLGFGLKVINVKDFGDRWRPDISILDEIDPAGLRVDRHDLRAGDILFVRSNGNKDLVGRSMLIEENLENVSFSGFCIRFRPVSKESNSKFLSLYFRTPLFRRTLSLQ